VVVVAASVCTASRTRVGGHYYETLRRIGDRRNPNNNQRTIYLFSSTHIYRVSDVVVANVSQPIVRHASSRTVAMRKKPSARLRPILLPLVLLTLLGLGSLWRLSPSAPAARYASSAPETISWHDSDLLRGNDRLAYRRHLEATTSPPGYSHSRTLNFSHIYVVSLAGRQDRRERMSRIATALGIDLTFIEATSTAENGKFIQWLGERAYEARVRKRDYLAQALKRPPEKIGGLGIDTVWLATTGWELPGTHRPLRLPSLSDQSRFRGKDWMRYFDEVERTGQISRLAPDDPNFNLTAALWDPLEKRFSRQVVPAVLAAWHSHVKAIKAILRNGDESALILEDDVDMCVGPCRDSEETLLIDTIREWDIERMWATIKRRIRTDWEIVRGLPPLTPDLYS
jgi:hypothetical protein